MNLNSMIWKLKKDRGLSLRAEIKEATIHEHFRPIEKDLIAAHGIKKLSYGDKLQFTF